MAKTNPSNTSQSSLSSSQPQAGHLNASAERSFYSRRLELYAFRGISEDDWLADDEHAIVFSEDHPAERLSRLRELRKAKGIKRRRETVARKRRNSWCVLITPDDHIRAGGLGVLLI